MGAVAFNTYEFIKSLTDARMDEEQAAAISAGILRAHEVANLATKADVDSSVLVLRTELREEVSALKTELREEMANLRTELRESLAHTDTKIEKVEANLDAKIDKIGARSEQQIIELRGEMKLLKWMLGMTLTGVGSLIVMAAGLVIKAFIP